MRPCPGCSHPTICRTHGCAAEEVRRNRRAALVKQAWERTQRIASVAAEELVRDQCEHTNTADEFWIAGCQADDHMRDCIAHLVWIGRAVSHELDDGRIVVQLGDFTVGGG